ncbi:MAG: DUF935 domain-containing protein [Thalassobaculales bacterium]
MAATLYGPDGRPIDRALLRREIAGPTVTGVRQVVSGHPSGGLTPQRLAAILRRAEEGDADSYYELAEDIEEKDLHYLGVLGTRKRAVCQMEITVEAAGDDADRQAIRHADFVRDWLRRDSLEDELFDMADAIGKHHSVVEIVWEVSDGQFVPARLVWQDPRWFVYDTADGRSLKLRGDNGEMVDLPAAKFIHTEIRAKSGMPIRTGLARPAAWFWMFKSYTLKDWITFLEVYGLPLRIGKHPAGATPEEIDALARAVGLLGTDAAAVISDGMTIEFERGVEASNAAIFRDAAEYWDQQISKAVLGQTATTDAIAGGHAVGRIHNEVRQDILRADAKSLRVAINRDLVRPMIDLNFGPQRAYPRVMLGFADAADLAVWMPALRSFVEMGGRVGAAAVRDKLGIEDPDGDEDLLRPPGAAFGGRSQPDAPAPQDRPPAQATAAHSATAQDLPPADRLDQLRLAAMAEAAQMEGPLDAALLAAIEDAASYDDLLARLGGWLRAGDDAGLAELLARARFAARIAGELEILADLGGPPV